MKIEIDKEIFNLNPNLKICVCLAKDFNHEGKLQELYNLIKNFEVPENLLSIKEIYEWKLVYSKIRALRYKTHLENMLKHFKMHKNIPIHGLHDEIVKYISLKYFVPCRCIDFDKIVGNIKLTFAKNEKPVLVIGEIEPKKPAIGEVVYKDDEGVITRRFNWRDAERVKVTENSKNILFIVETLTNKVEDIEKDLKNILKSHSKEVKTWILDKDNRIVEIN